MSGRVGCCREENKHRSLAHGAEENAQSQEIGLCARARHMHAARSAHCHYHETLQSRSRSRIEAET